MWHLDLKTFFSPRDLGDLELVGITLKAGPACSRLRPTGASTWLSEGG